LPTYREWIAAFRDLGLGPHSRLLVHASLAPFSPDVGGPQALLGALIATCEIVVAPTFTTRTLVTPPFGPAYNGLRYGDDPSNQDAELFHADLPTDPLLADLAEAMRQHPSAERSTHPALSFCGIRAGQALATQSLEEPLAPVRWLAEADADVLLIGTDHRRNVGLHHAERLAGRKSFVRWALTEQGVVACPQFPGCSDGFNAVAGRLEGTVRRATLAGQEIEALPLRDLIHVASGWIREDPRALLCDRPGCERCADVRQAVRAGAGTR
jgi:aminoglycoside 3-N-acetyltransferase